MSRPVQSPAALRVAGGVAHFGAPPELELDPEPEPELDADPEVDPELEPELDAELEPELDAEPEAEPELEPGFPDEDPELASPLEPVCPEEDPELEPEAADDPERPASSAVDCPLPDVEPPAPMSVAATIRSEIP